MSDAVKWAILIGILVASIALVFALPALGQVVPAVGYLKSSVEEFVDTMLPYLQQARSLILILVPVQIRVFMWNFIKITILSPFAIFPIKFVIWLYHFIFK